MGAGDYFRVLVRDYPRSPKRRDAQAWLSENEVEIEKEAFPRTEESGVNLLSEVTIPESPDSLPLPREESELIQVELRYAVQLGAFLLEERAERLMEVGEDAGFVTRLVRVRESDLIHVRIGNFAERAEAVKLMQRIRELGYDAIIVTDVTLEELFG